MPRPFSARQSTAKNTADIVSGAVPVVLYLRHGTCDGDQSLDAQHEQVLAFLAAHTTGFHLTPTGNAAGRSRVRAAGPPGSRADQRRE